MVMVNPARVNTNFNPREWTPASEMNLVLRVVEILPAPISRESEHEPAISNLPYQKLFHSRGIYLNKLWNSRWLPIDWLTLRSWFKQKKHTLFNTKSKPSLRHIWAVSNGFSFPTWILYRKNLRYNFNFLC